MLGARETTNCELCDRSTPRMVTKRCDRCRDLERLIEETPSIALRIIYRVMKERSNT